MSILLGLSEDKLDQVGVFILKYEKIVEEAATIFQLEGRRLELIARNLPHHQSVHDQHFHDLKSLEEWLSAKRDKVGARLWRKYLEGYPRALSSKDIQAYIAGEPDYVAYTELMLEVGNLKAKMFAIVEALKQMGWMVGHITKLRVAELQDAIV